jgi:hypothetical protein
VRADAIPTVPRMCVSFIYVVIMISNHRETPYVIYDGSTNKKLTHFL